MSDFSGSEAQHVLQDIKKHLLNINMAISFILEKIMSGSFNGPLTPTQEQIDFVGAENANNGCFQLNPFQFAPHFSTHHANSLCDASSGFSTLDNTPNATMCPTNLSLKIDDYQQRPNLPLNLSPTNIGVIQTPPSTTASASASADEEPLLNTMFAQSQPNNLDYFSNWLEMVSAASTTEPTVQQQHSPSSIATTNNEHNATAGANGAHFFDGHQQLLRQNQMNRSFALSQSSMRMFGRQVEQNERRRCFIADTAQNMHDLNHPNIVSSRLSTFEPAKGVEIDEEDKTTETRKALASEKKVAGKILSFLNRKKSQVCTTNSVTKTNEWEKKQKAAEEENAEERFLSEAILRAAQRATRNQSASQPKIFAWQIVREAISDKDLRGVRISVRSSPGDCAAALMSRQHPTIRAIVRQTLKLYGWYELPEDELMAKTKMLLGHLKNNAKVRNWSLRREQLAEQKKKNENNSLGGEERTSDESTKTLHKNKRVFDDASTTPAAASNDEFWFDQPQQAQQQQQQQACPPLSPIVDEDVEAGHRSQESQLQPPIERFLALMNEHRQALLDNSNKQAATVKCE